MDKNKIKKIKILLGIVFAVIAVFSIISIYIYSKSDGYNYLNEGFYKFRGIETPLKLWGNGYLGIFFNFKYFGFLNWLMLPVLIYFAFTIERKQQWQRALFFVYALSVIIICIKGYFNFRYSFSLFPFTIIAVLWFIWDFVEKKPRKFRIIVISILFLLAGFSFCKYYRQYRGYLTSAMSYQIKNKEILLIDYIKTLQINDENNILVCNISEFFYFTDIKAIMHKDLRPSSDTPEKLFEEIIKKKIKYILVADYIHSISIWKNLSDVVKQGTIMLKRSGKLAVYEIIANP